MTHEASLSAYRCWAAFLYLVLKSSSMIIVYILLRTMDQRNMLSSLGDMKTSLLSKIDQFVRHSIWYHLARVVLSGQYRWDKMTLLYHHPGNCTITKLLLKLLARAHLLLNRIFISSLSKWLRLTCRMMNLSTDYSSINGRVKQTSRVLIRRFQRILPLSNKSSSG